MSASSARVVRQRGHGEPLGLRVGGRDADHEPELRPRHRAGLEGGRDRRQRARAAHDGRDALELPCREPELLARVVVDAREAEPLYAVPPEEGTGQPPEDDPAARVLVREPPEPAVEERRGEIGVGMQGEE
jgi:hypothetical protein